MATEYLKELIRKKNVIEKDIQIWYDVLKSQGNVGMDSALVDSEGYPRNDVDVVQVRTARHNIICLQNDHKDIMKQIENGLVEFHAQNAESSRSSNMDQVSQPDGILEPFAAVNLISSNSPAEKCGLKLGDVLLQFGSVTKKNFVGMNAIAGVVQHSKGKPVNVVVKRSEKTVAISLIPQEWEGRGFLGCNIVPL